MTKEQLKQIRQLKNEIELLKAQIQEIEHTITTDTVKGSDTSFPYSSHSIMIRGIDEDDYNRKVRRYQKRIRKRVHELVELLEVTNEYIEGINDSMIRQIIILRYVNGLGWKDVATKLGGNNTADSVRMMLDRYLGKY
jgi:hypothetical protein